MFNVDWVSSFRSTVSTQRFVNAFKKQVGSRYRLKNWPFLQVANPGLILFATGPPSLGKIELSYPERRFPAGNWTATRLVRSLAIGAAIVRP